MKKLTSELAKQMEESKKIIKKLKEIKNSLEKLKNIHHSEGEAEFEKQMELIRRIIDRIYSEKDAKELKDKLVHKVWILTGNESDEYWQNFYLDNINRSLRMISIILEESDLFGFDNFKPIKEKTETEVCLGLGKLAFWRRKKTKQNE